MEQKLRGALYSQKTYSDTKEFRLKILDGDQDTFYLVQQVIVSILNEKKVEPFQKLMALKFAKDCIEVFNDKFISQAQNTILPVVEKYAMHMFDVQDYGKGKYMFSETPNIDQTAIGNSIFQLSLECIWVWSKWFPIDPETNLLSYYKISCLKLLKLGVQFQKLSYFKVKMVMKHLPEMTAPIRMLKQATTIIENELRKGDVIPTNKVIIAQLDLQLTSQAALWKKDVFYSQILHRCIKRITAQRKGYKYTNSQDVKELRMHIIKLQETIKSQAAEIYSLRNGGRAPPQVNERQSNNYLIAQGITYTDNSARNVSLPPARVQTLNYQDTQAQQRVNLLRSSQDQNLAQQLTGPQRNQKDQSMASQLTGQPAPSMLSQLTGQPASSMQKPQLITSNTLINPKQQYNNLSSSYTLNDNRLVTNTPNQFINLSPATSQFPSDQKQSYYKDIQKEYDENPSRQKGMINQSNYLAFRDNYSYSPSPSPITNSSYIRPQASNVYYK